MILVFSILAAIQSSPASTPFSTPLDPESRARIIAAAPALADMPDTMVATYPVDGRTPQAIRASINRGRPSDVEGGERFDAVTRWSYQANWRRSGPDQCLADTAEVTMAVKIILPDLISRDRLSTREKAAWDGYFQRLVAHELNHGRIAALGSQRMQAALREATSCAEMQATRERLGTEIRDANREYDRTSEHGRLEGAVYPPMARR